MLRERSVVFDEKKIDDIFSGVDQCDLPGAAVGIAIGGKPVYRKGFGLASMELPVLLSPTIRMRIGNATKHFTSLAYLLLCEDGKAAIDDPLGKYLPELHPVTHNVTMRQLMGHLSGLPDVSMIRFRFSGVGGRPVTADELVSLYRDIGSANPPGTHWAYGHGPFLLLTAVIERVTGQPLEEVLRSRIFEPAGMFDTMLRRWDTDFVPNSATLHMSNAAGHYVRADWGLDFAGARAAVSTIDDMLRWLAHMDNPIVGTEETWRLMKTSQTLSNGTQTGCALSLMLGEYRGAPTISQLGGWLGGTSQMLKVPDAGLDVVVMTNRLDVSAIPLANQILDACLPELDPIEQRAPAHFAVGIFRSETSGRVIQLFPRNGVQVAAIDASEYVVQNDGDALRPAGLFSFLKYAFTLVGDPERPTEVRFDDFGNVEEFSAVRAEGNPTPDAITGHYCSDEIQTDVTIVASGDEIHLTSFGHFGEAQYKLKSIAENIWWATSLGILPDGGVLLFDSAGFTFSDKGMLQLRFRRVAEENDDR